MAASIELELSIYFSIFLLNRVRKDIIFCYKTLSDGGEKKVQRGTIGERWIERLIIGVTIPVSLIRERKESNLLKEGRKIIL